MLGFVVRRLRGRLPPTAAVPFVVLVPAARPPMPEALIEPPTGQALLFAAAIALAPLLSAFLIGRRRPDVANRLRHVEEM
ncbi:hypothetical protein ACIRVF_03910 [Kitasatospora sp. NPDC101157]|uniref:hypothetical protein n=1 Tax=Kitasatospora sp. NPDC101157 TaxID=3364098 RepID=UPI00382CCFD9